MNVSLKIMLNPLKKRKDGTRTIVLRLTIGRERSYISLGFNAHENDWNERKDCFRKSYNVNAFKEDNERLKLYLYRANEIILAMQREGIEITHKNFKQRFSQKNNKLDVYAFFDEIIEEFEAKGKLKTASTYEQSKNALKRFYGKKTLRFSDIDVEFLNKLEADLSKTCTGNAISVYFRSIRALFNKAISRKICKAGHYPFYNNQNQRGYKIKQLETPTRKRAISTEEIKKVLGYQLEVESSLWDTKQMFLFSFYNMGMNFIDMAYLQWRNVAKDRIFYQRKKSKAQFSIKILKPVREILDYYRNFQNDLGYVFPVFNEFHKTDKQKFIRIQTARKKFNDEIRIIAKLAGVKNYNELTSYVIRHTWASTMRSLGFSAGYIKEGFKHSDEKVTEIYLKEIENTAVDDMNEKLLDF